MKLYTIFEVSTFKGYGPTFEGLPYTSLYYLVKYKFSKYVLTEVTTADYASKP